MTTSKDSRNALLGRLQKLKEAPSTADHTDLVEEVLEAAYDTGKAAYKQGVTELPYDEKIISLINDTAEQIEAAVFEIGLKFDIDRAPYNLLLRSGLQFIVDYLKNVKIQNGRVSVSGQKSEQKALRYWRENDGIETFDEGIENWKDCNGFTEEYVVHSYKDLCKPAWVPESHSWWFGVTDGVKQVDSAAVGD